MNRSPVTGNDIAGPKSESVDLAQLLDKKALAELLGCSSRHIDRLTHSGRLPAPVKLGALVRWSRKTITDWVEAGCPPIA